MKKADVGLIGLAVMGENLAVNIASHGFKVAVYNRTVKKAHDFVQRRGGALGVTAADSLAEFAAALEKPRKIILMVKAGQAVDQMLEELLPHLEPGDILMDGGNSYYQDTVRRYAEMERKGLRYIGMGISGGEEGALNGPSIMPGGCTQAWPLVQPVLQSICAKTDDNKPCCQWMGGGGAGHYVKMVHNGIEYGDMQLICESYHMMRNVLRMSCDEMRDVFLAWNNTELNSYLIQITADILAYQDEDGQPLLDKILDAAGQKGTGKWSGMEALERGVPLTLISEAVFARCMSAAKEERIRASRAYGRTDVQYDIGDRAVALENLRQALLASKVVSYAQGFALMRSAAKAFGWELNPSTIAQIWRGGCIICSSLLGRMEEAFNQGPDLENLLLAPYFRAMIQQALPAWRETAAAAVRAGIPIPAMGSALSYFDGYTSEYLPANLLQAQRDYFGAHTYERLDAQRGEFFHTNWTGRGGSTAASTYQV